MDNGINKLWPERLFDRIPIHYLWTILVMFFIIYFIILTLFHSVDNSYFNAEFFISLASALFAFSFILAEIEYLIKNTRTILSEVRDISHFDYDPSNQFDLLAKSKKYILIIFWLIFLIILYSSGLTWPLSRSSLESTFFNFAGSYQGNLLTAILNFLIIIGMLFFATLFWLLYIFYNISNSTSNYLINAYINPNQVEIEKIIRMFRNLIYKYFLFNVISIYLFAVFCSGNLLIGLDTDTTLKGQYEDVISGNLIGIPYLFAGVLFLVVIIFLIFSLNDMRMVSRKIREDEANAIESKYRKQIQELLNFSPSENYEESTIKLNYLSSYIEILDRQQERIRKSTERNNLVSYAEFLIINIGAILGTIIIPILTILEKIRH
jgi:hypothetical protein